MAWVKIRSRVDPRKLLCEYEPERQLIRIKLTGFREAELVDLTDYSSSARERPSADGLEPRG